MPLPPGARFGAYEILSALGAGGMGEVYRARDTTLNRDVAIKIVLPAVADDPERLARFSREAQVLASINHANIAAIYGVADAADCRGLVMELVEGPTLGDRIAQGGLPIDEALAVARQIAAALEAAHELGIVHRDLKPANIKVRADGTVKVLDFGLAKAIEPAAAGSGSAGLMNSPTITSPALMTGRGVILGTAAYMAPEQARGRVVDTRADIWAFGCVLFEMLTRRQAFAGDDVSDTLASVIKDDPAWHQLPAATPSGIRRLLKRCLEKNPSKRLQAIGDARIEIDDAIDTPDDHAAAGTASPAGRSPRSVPIVAALAIAVVLLAAGIIAARLVSVPAAQRSLPAAGVTRSLISVTPADRLRANNSVEDLAEGRPSRTAMALSPDGRSLVFSAIHGDQQQLYFRALDRLGATPMAGTEGGASPFFSPDGQWVGFWSKGALRRVAVSGDGGATTICETGSIFGASWGSNGTIAFAHFSPGLWQVPAAGGTPQPLTQLDGTQHEVSHRLPQMLPGNAAVLFTVTRSAVPKWEDTRIVVQSLTSGERKELLQGADARYVSTGHLVYARAGALFAVPFNLDRLEVTGAPVSMIPDLMQAAYMPNVGNDSGAGQFSVSASGALVYLPGGMFPDLERSLVWVDRSGSVQPLAAPTRAYFAPRLSPDGQRVLVWTSGTDRNVWVYDLVRGTLTPLTTEGRNSYSIWTPDGQRVTFSSDTGAGALLWKSADGTGTAERVTPDEVTGNPISWSPNRTLAISRGGDIWALSLDGDRRPHPIVQSRFSKAHPDFSPDGRWLAYYSNESGRDEVYVQPYPGPGPRQQISTGGGTGPAWSQDGRELFYQTMSQRPGEALGVLTIMAMPITTRPAFSAGIPKALFQLRAPLTTLGTRGYDVTRDGRRFLMVQDKQRPPLKATEMILVQNWFEELKRRVPAK